MRGSWDRQGFQRHESAGLAALQLGGGGEDPRRRRVGRGPAWLRWPGDMRDGSRLVMMDDDE